MTKLTVRATPGVAPMWSFHEEGRSYMEYDSEGKKRGRWLSINHESKLTGFVTIKNNKQHGEQIVRYPNGQVKYNWNWKDGVYHGRCMDWAENGMTKFQGHYKDGQKHGKWWEWYPNGRLSVAGKFENGLAIGLKAWMPCGEKCPLTGVVNGYGWWVHYDSNGEELYKTEISGGKMIDEYEVIDGDEWEDQEE